MKRYDLQVLVGEILEVEPEVLRPETVLADLENFDSVMLLSLMIRLDEGAGVKMSPSDVPNLRTYGDIEALALSQGIELSD